MRFGGRWQTGYVTYEWGTLIFISGQLFSVIRMHRERNPYVQALY